MCYGFDGESAVRRALGERGLSRRGALRTALGGAVGAGLLAAGVAAPAAQATVKGTGRHRVPPGLISMQLYTVRSALQGEPGFDATLRMLADTGYPKVEQALGYFGRTARELRAFYDSIGVSATSGHDGISDSEQALHTKIDNALTLGQSYMVVPYLNSSDKADWQRWAERMNHEADVARSAGLHYGYHNHAHEFTIDLGGGVTPWQVLTSELDPKLVHLEIDIYWVVRGGIESGDGARDPEGFAIDTMRAAPQQVLQYHVKDRHAHDGDMADLGTGHIDFARIFRAHSVREYIVENDTPDVSVPRTSEVGYSYLRNLRF
ncbi:sugar phosphate isomerase/epimerase family protein [Prauserella alba]|uniref:Sugar phosphate isomerase/epimerase n=1 Tax=Prauserella alba TaxID=176898 RepID=A0ABN1VJA0_9PSEU|nr:TIM barrel protein [Prauserella alba]MCP2183481.1 Sugar phosphate isomerase/epimerase [Prauserella alba]